MRAPKILLAIWLLVLSLAINGCNLLPNTNKTRPAPTRPRITTPTPNPKVRPAPTKRIPGASSITEKQVLDRLAKIENSLKKDNWSVANRETNRLGIDMTKFRPTASKGKSLRETAKFDAMYTKLQADMKTKNKSACKKDIESLQDAMRDMKSSQP